MRTPSPDAATITLADRILAVPQYAGARLPALLMGGELARIATWLAALACAAPLAEHYDGAVGLFVFKIFILGHCAWAIMLIIAYARDARAWGPRLHAEYHRRARRQIERLWWSRVMAWGEIAIATVAWGCRLPSQHPDAMAFAVALTTTSVVNFALAYAACASPREPQRRLDLAGQAT